MSTPSPTQPPTTPFAVFSDPDIWTKLAAHPDTRPYVADSGFRKTIEALGSSSQPDPSTAQRALADPRVMAALGALSGMRIDVTDEDLRRAERVGDMPKRDAVQTADVEVALQYTTAEDAKAAGNARFKAEEYGAAIACYQRAIELVSVDERALVASTPPHELVGVDKTAELAALRATLLSNTAAALLKLARPKEALEACAQACTVAPAGAGVSKAHYRAAQAHEQLKEFGLALEALGRAAAGGGEPKLMARERARVQRLADQAERDAKARKAQLDREAAAEALRAAGTPLAAPPTGAKAGGGANGDVGKGGSGYLSERDLSHWAAQWLAERVKGLAHVAGGCRIEVTGLNAAASEVHASMKEKRGRRALYYDASLVLDWKGTTTLGLRPGEEPRGMAGVFMMYNVGQDTRFCPGGDKETSYMYELGFPRDYYGPSAPWAEEVKAEAAELFHLVGALVSGEWAGALARRAGGGGA